MPKLKHRQLTVIGPIASGKTTASRLLADAFSLPLLDADLFETNPFLPAYIQDNARWSFATELFFTLARLKKLRTLPRLLRRSSVVVDSGLIMSHQVYTKNHLVEGTMTASEWEFFTQIVADYTRSLPEPDIVVHLLASPPVQLARIGRRGRSFESGYTLPYLASITDRLSEYAQSLESRRSVVYLPFNSEKWDLTHAAGQAELLKLVRPHLPAEPGSE